VTDEPHQPLEAEVRFIVDPRHPALEGHFPGNPLLPGVVLLDEVITAAEAWVGGGWRTGGLPRAKFLSPLKPGDEAVIRLVRRQDQVDFKVLCQGVMVAQGALAPDIRPDPQSTPKSK